MLSHIVLAALLPFAVLASPAMRASSAATLAKRQTLPGGGDLLDVEKYEECVQSCAGGGGVQDVASDDTATHSAFGSGSCGAECRAASLITRRQVFGGLGDDNGNDNDGYGDDGGYRNAGPTPATANEGGGCYQNCMGSFGSTDVATEHTAVHTSNGAGFCKSFCTYYQSASGATF
ncbi:hypothetical protein GGR56DRAFT_692370 [Xylariaceae sp. FL0804]|nr:hypothetical protein GGR56DRAFT_692370 [Xylariaceae sp. FL0804]